MGALVMLVVLASLSVGICVLAARVGHRPDSSLQEIAHFHRLFGLRNTGLPSDWPATQLRANRAELRNIAGYGFRSRQRS
ncbi:MAG TPA: hypothetical protein VET82_00775 [Candidatus Eisenbacteria bacterium]|nr:hypothetical protein [Candidatus Eisenbacteria bacterium]